MASPWDYFRAGAQDFGTDASNMVNGRLTGPTMTNRRALMDAEPASFDARFGFGSMAPTAGASPAINQLQQFAKTLASGMKKAFPQQPAPAPVAGPAVPADGAMQPTIGPGAVPGPGGIAGLLQGQSPQGLLGMLKSAMPGPAAAPLAAMPQAGMLPGMPGSPVAGPVAPPPPQLPTNIDPMNQF